MKAHNLIILASALALALMLIATINVRADADGDDDDDHHCWNESWGDGWWGFWLMPMMFGGILIFFLVVFLLQHEARGNTSGPNNEAMKVAMDRYACDDIDRAQYIRILEDIKR